MVMLLTPMQMTKSLILLPLRYFLLFKLLLNLWVLLMELMRDVKGVELLGITRDIHVSLDKVIVEAAHKVVVKVQRLEHYLGNELAIGVYVSVFADSVVWSFVVGVITGTV